MGERRLLKVVRVSSNSFRCEGVSYLNVIMAEEHSVELELMKPGKPGQSSHGKRLNRTFCDEVLICMCSKYRMRFDRLPRTGYGSATKSGLMTH